MQKRCLSVFAVLLALIGCASVPKAVTERDVAAKQFSPVPGKSNLYIVRPSESPSELVTFKIFVDGKLIAELDPGTYQMVSVESGSHTIKATAAYSSAELEVVTEADKNSFCQVNTTSGIRNAVPELTLIDSKISINQASIAPALP